MYVLERDYSRDRLWCLLVLSLDAQSDRVGVFIDGNVNFKECLCSPTRFSSYLIHEERFRAMSFMHVDRGSIIRLIVLMLLRVATSESMIPMPYFPPLLYRLLSILLLVCLLPLLLQN